MDFWKKRIKNTTRLSNELNVEEEKINELKNGEREIGGKTMSKVLEVLDTNEVQTKIKDYEIMKWYYEADFAELQKQFGFSSQKELAIALKSHQSEVCRMKKHVFSKLNKVIERAYYFFNNDFNKKSYDDKLDEKTDYKEQIATKKEILKWFNKNNLAKLRRKQNLKQNELISLINIPQSTYSSIEEKSTRKDFQFEILTKSMIKVYNYYNGIVDSIQTETENEVQNENINDEQPQQQLNINVDDTYQVVQDESIEPKEEKDIIIEQLVRRNKELHRQIERYEKLIDKL